jgi:uncharacterized protein YxjI
MKQFYMKQKVFSFGEKYNVFDQNQNLVYHIKGQVFSIKNKMDMFKGDQLVFHFERKLFRFLPEYTLYTPNGEVLATIKKNFTFIRGKLTIESAYGNMELIGQVWQRDFNLTKEGREVMSVHKKWLSWGDSYEITITDDEKEAFYVALVILVDVIFHQSSGNSNASHHH